MGWPLDRIVHAEVWATDTIPADLPPMVEFKFKVDKIIRERWGIEVEHLCAARNGEKLTYDKLFYHTPKRKPKSKAWVGKVMGYPMQKGPWCNSKLKIKALSIPGLTKNIVQYLGIAADEPERIARHEKPGIKMPLVKIGWDEAYCRKWCEDNDLLSPIYTTATRGGCWFCHNQGVGQLRLLRKNYPDLWALMLKWDSDSPVTFKADGHTVHDFDRRFQLEDEGMIYVDDKVFRWSMLDDELNYRLF